MSIKVDNAIIMAAGTSSRFAPISYERPKALIEVNGQVLIERQIEQLQEVGIYQIIVVVGYKKELFYYLADKYNVIIVENIYYNTRNNNASIFAVSDYLKNSYICSADNYFVENPFKRYEEFPFYSAVYENGLTKEWCIKEDINNYICEVTIGGYDQWVMLGHAFWDKKFSKDFLKILHSIFNYPETHGLFWENIYANNLDLLKLKIKKWDKGLIKEFDTLDELRSFDTSYLNNTRSPIIKTIVSFLNCEEKDIHNCCPLYSNDNEAVGFTFEAYNITYKYIYSTRVLEEHYL